MGLVLRFQVKGELLFLSGFTSEKLDCISEVLCGVKSHVAQIRVHTYQSIVEEENI